MVGRHAFVVGGLSGDAGKTLVSLGLSLALRARGHDVQPFKKGPDYIDAAWLSWAAGRAARNLDTWMAGFERVRASFDRHALSRGVSLVEGNRGLFDGSDAQGTHGTAALAKTLGLPVVLVVDARKATTTVAASVLGCQVFDPDLRIAGVILNRVAGARHERVAREAIASRCSLPVFGAVPALEDGCALRGRHLGLVTPEEHDDRDRVRRTALDAAAHIDLDALLEACRDEAEVRATPEPASAEAAPAGVAIGSAPGAPRIGYLRDSAFSFYYPENLEALRDAGALLVAVSSLDGQALPPDLDALYIGGGFPETHAVPLAANQPLLSSIRAAADAGLPIYAECGGLMLLSAAIRTEDRRHPMAGVLPFDVELCARPQGHGYSALSVDRPNPFFAEGTQLKGHEFHYSRPVDSDAWRALLPQATACAVRRGTGCGAGRDGVTLHNVWASYTHLHADAAPRWADAMLAAARRYEAGSSGQQAAGSRR